MFMTEELQQKWQPVLEHPELEAIKDPYKKAVTALVLENQSHAMREDRRMLSETSDPGPTNIAGGVQNFDPILISLVRRSLPNLIAYDVAGVQPMTGPTVLTVHWQQTQASTHKTMHQVQAILHQVSLCLQALLKDLALMVIQHSSKWHSALRK
jgi:mannosyltransferase OCH1-like enzyme